MTAVSGALLPGRAAALFLPAAPTRAKARIVRGFGPFRLG